jgi:uncharacterized protein (TIGR02722 family)
MWIRALFGIAVGMLVTSGCSAFRRSVSQTDLSNPVLYDARYGYADLRSWGKAVGDTIVGSDFVKGLKASPIFVVMGVQNRTTQHVDTKALTDTMRTTIMEAGKAQFVNESRRDDLLKEQGYQLANCTPETQAAIGRQLGAGYMLTGSLVEIKKESGRQVRVSAQEEIYYQLTMEITDLTTGLIVWTKQEERALTTSKPLFGW